MKKEDGGWDLKSILIAKRMRSYRSKLLPLRVGWVGIEGWRGLCPGLNWAGKGQPWFLARSGLGITPPFLHRLGGVRLGKAGPTVGQGRPRLAKDVTARNNSSASEHH